MSTADLTEPLSGHRFNLSILDMHRAMREYRNQLPSNDENARLLGKFFNFRERREAMSILRDAVDEEMMNEGVFAGSFQDFFQWLLDHQEQIMAFVKMIMALFGV
jgi:hypothetical protein